MSSGFISFSIAGFHMLFAPFACCFSPHSAAADAGVAGYLSQQPDLVQVLRDAIESLNLPLVATLLPLLRIMLTVSSSLVHSLLQDYSLFVKLVFCESFAIRLSLVHICPLVTWGDVDVVHRLLWRMPGAFVTSPRIRAEVWRILSLMCFAVDFGPDGSHKVVLTDAGKGADTTPFQPSVCSIFGHLCTRAYVGCFFIRMCLYVCMYVSSFARLCVHAYVAE